MFKCLYVIFIYHLSIQKGCPMQDFYRMKQPLWVLFSIRK